MLKYDDETLCKLLKARTKKEFITDCIAIKKIFEVDEIYESIFIDVLDAIMECIKDESLERIITSEPGGKLIAMK